MLSVALFAMTKRGQRVAWNAWRGATGQRSRTRKLLQQALARMQGSLAARVSIPGFCGMIVDRRVASHAALSGIREASHT